MTMTTNESRDRKILAEFNAWWDDFNTPATQLRNADEQTARIAFAAGYILGQAADEREPIEEGNQCDTM